MAKVFDHSGLAHEYIPRFTICGVPDSLVDELKALPLDKYLAYADAILSRNTAVLEGASEAEPCREVSFGGRMVPLAQRATGFAHVYRHIGMMEDVRGSIRGPGKGSVTQI